MHKRLNLTTLPLADASDLASIADAAAIHFGNAADAARTVIAANGPGRWRDQHEAELAEAVRLRALAQALVAAAHARERLAGREQCVAVRVIEALAHALADRPVERRRAA